MSDRSNSQQCGATVCRYRCTYRTYCRYVTFCVFIVDTRYTFSRLHDLTDHKEAPTALNSRRPRTGFSANDRVFREKHLPAWPMTAVEGNYSSRKVLLGHMKDPTNMFGSHRPVFGLCRLSEIKLR